MEETFMVLPLDKTLVYSDDDEPLVTRLGAAALACWPELTSHVQGRLIRRAEQMLEMDGDDGANRRLQRLVGAHASTSLVATDGRDPRSAATWIARVLRVAHLLLGPDVNFVTHFADDGGAVGSVGVVSRHATPTDRSRSPPSFGYIRKIIDADLPELTPNTLDLVAAPHDEATHSSPDRCACWPRLEDSERNDPTRRTA